MPRLVSNARSCPKNTMKFADAIEESQQRREVAGVPLEPPGDVDWYRPSSKERRLCRRKGASGSTDLPMRIAFERRPTEVDIPRPTCRNFRMRWRISERLFISKLHNKCQCPHWQELEVITVNKLIQNIVMNLIWNFLMNTSQLKKAMTHS